MIHLRTVYEFLLGGNTGNYQCIKEIHLTALEWEDLRAKILQTDPQRMIADERPREIANQVYFSISGVKIIRVGEL